VRMLNNLTTLVRILDHCKSVHKTDAQAAEIARKCLIAIIDKMREEHLAHEEKMKGAAGERASWPRVGGSCQMDSRGHTSCPCVMLDDLHARTCVFSFTHPNLNPDAAALHCIV
jgi:hypothetical protein